MILVVNEKFFLREFAWLQLIWRQDVSLNRLINIIYSWNIINNKFASLVGFEAVRSKQMNKLLKAVEKFNERAWPVVVSTIWYIYIYISTYNVNDMTLI